MLLSICRLRRVVAGHTLRQNIRVSRLSWSPTPLILRPVFPSTPIHTVNSRNYTIADLKSLPAAPHSEIRWTCLGVGSEENAAAVGELVIVAVRVSVVVPRPPKRRKGRRPLVQASKTLLYHTSVQGLG